MVANLEVCKSFLNRFYTIYTIRNPTIQNPVTFENWTFWRSDFKWWNNKMVAVSDAMAAILPKPGKSDFFHRYLLRQKRLDVKCIKNEFFCIYFFLQKTLNNLVHSQIPKIDGVNNLYH